jgi:hypothetical protein
MDLFEKNRPAIFALKIRKEFGQWCVLGYFNWEEDSTAPKDFDLTLLGLDPEKTFLIYDFWSQRLLAEVTRTARLALEPSSVRLVAIHEKRGVPQVVGTDRHWTQGAVELESARWDNESLTLSGSVLGAPNHSWKLAIYVPERYSWDEKGSEYFQDFAGYSARLEEEKLLRAHFDFAGTDRIHWAVKFRETHAQ